MPARVVFKFRFIFCFFIILIVIPCSEILAQSSGSDMGDLSKESVGAIRLNQGAVEKLRQMNPENVKALDEKLARALTLYYDEQYVQALPIFLEISGQIETMDILFWTGMCASKAGQHQIAVEKFQRMLSVDSTLYRVKLELALVYYKLQKFDEARKELKEVKAASPPEDVMANIEKLDKAIENKTRDITWNLRVAQGYLFDDNINTRSDPGIYNFPGITGTWNATGLDAKLRDEALVTSIAGNALFSIKKNMMWNFSGMLYNKAYTEYSQFNYFVVDLSTGPLWVGRTSVLNLPFGITESQYESERLARVVHVDPSYEYFFNRYFSLKGFYSYAEERYFPDFQAARLNNKRNRFALIPSLYLKDRKHILSLEVGFDDLDATSDVYSYDDPYITFSYFAGLKYDLEFFTRYMWIRKEYREAQDFLPYTGLNRIDKYQNLTVTVSKKLYKKLFGSLAYNYTDNRSNLELYSYDKSTFTISAEIRF